MNAYILCKDNYIKSVHKSYEGARKALVEHIKELYEDWEIEDFDHMDGYKTVEKYLEAMLTNDRLDNIYGMEIEEHELED